MSTVKFLERKSGAVKFVDKQSAAVTFSAPHALRVKCTVSPDDSGKFVKLKFSPRMPVMVKCSTPPEGSGKAVQLKLTTTAEAKSVKPSGQRPMDSEVAAGELQVSSVKGSDPPNVVSSVRGKSPVAHPAALHVRLFRLMSS